MYRHLNEILFSTMHNYLLFVFIICCSFYGYTEAGSIPDYIHTCKRTDPELAKCIRESIEVLRPKLKQGIPEINVPGLEPLRLNEISVVTGSQNSNFKILLTNVDVTGAGDFQITKLKVDVEKLIFRVGVKIPALQMEGDYDVNVRILVAPITGHGKFFANATNCDGQAVIHAEVVDNKLKFTAFDFSATLDDYYVHLDNLFNGDKVLNEATNQMLNQNKDQFIPIAIPFIEKKASEILLELAGKITETFDYDELFPE